ncbi:MAG: hypothetical protein ABI947_29320 [Chloroflexota bacterium]
MESNFIYRFFKGTWGIYVSLTAEITPYSNVEEKPIETIRGVYLDIKAKLPIVEHQYLILGIALVKNQLEEWVNKNYPIIIKVVKLDIVLTDYQEEGLACALAGWIARELNLEYSEPVVYFSKEENRYIFPFSDLSL